MSPEAKKLVSAVLVSTAAAVIGVLQTYVVHLSPAVVAVAAPLLVGLAHYVNALGHAERVEAAKIDAVTAVLNLESRK